MVRRNSISRECQVGETIPLNISNIVAKLPLDAVRMHSSLLPLSLSN